MAFSRVSMSSLSTRAMNIGLKTPKTPYLIGYSLSSTVNNIFEADSLWNYELTRPSLRFGKLLSPLTISVRSFKHHGIMDLKAFHFFLLLSPLQSCHYCCSCGISFSTQIHLQQNSFLIQRTLFTKRGEVEFAEEIP